MQSTTKFGLALAAMLSVAPAWASDAHAHGMDAEETAVAMQTSTAARQDSAAYPCAGATAQGSHAVAKEKRSVTFQFPSTGESVPSQLFDVNGRPVASSDE